MYLRKEIFTCFNKGKCTIKQTNTEYFNKQCKRTSKVLIKIF